MICAALHPQCFYNDKPTDKTHKHSNRKSTSCPSLKCWMFHFAIKVHAWLLSFLSLFLFFLCFRQSQPSQSRSCNCSGPRCEWQSTRNSNRWGSYCLWELKARTSKCRGQVSVGDSPRKTQKHLFPFFFPSTSLTSNIKTFLQVKNTSEVKCWALSIKHSHFPGYMNSAPNCCFPQQFGLLTESWAIRDCEGTGESCLIIPHSKWVSQQQTMTALNRSSFQFALSSLWFIQIKKVFEIQRDQQHGKWLKGWFGKGWWSKD